MPAVTAQCNSAGGLSLPAVDRGSSMDEQAFAAFYGETARPLRAYLAGICGDAVLADDLVQEAYLRFLRARFEAEDDRHRRNYLFRIGTNLVRDHWRRRRELSSEAAERRGEPSHERPVHYRSDVGKAMVQLKPRDRQMLWLAYVEGSSHEEIAGVLGLKAASIRSMLFRARSRLAERLRALGLGPVWEDES